MAFDPQAWLANIAVVANETMRLVEVFRLWSEVDWQRPAYCPNWQVCDAVAHLATGGDFYAQVIAAGRTGEPRPPWGVSDVVGIRAARDLGRSSELLSSMGRSPTYGKKPNISICP